jgi:hypothetical protein
LIGFQGASEFDFHHNRFRTGMKRHPRSHKRPVIVST